MNKTVKSILSVFCAISGVLIFYALLFTHGILSFTGLSVSNVHPNIERIRTQLPKFYAIYSGSMEPYIKTGSVVIALPQSTYSINDVITYEKGKDTITHRITQKDNEKFITKGDANATLDSYSISEESIIGKVYFSVPYVGYVVDFAKTPQGFIALVVIPATIIVYEELKFLFASVKNAITKKSKKRNTKITTNTVTKKSNFTLQKTSVLLPVLGACAVFIAASASFLTDRETSNENVLSAATEYITPSPTSTPADSPEPLVLYINEVLPNVGTNSPEEWVEIYNPSDQEVDLEGFYLKDTAGNIRVLSGTMAAGEFFTYINEGTSWLNDGGDSLELFTDESESLDTFSYSSSSDDISLGKVPDGTGSIIMCTTASPSETNEGACL